MRAPRPISNGPSLVEACIGLGFAHAKYSRSEFLIVVAIGDRIQTAAELGYVLRKPETTRGWRLGIAKSIRPVLSKHRPLDELHR